MNRACCGTIYSGNKCPFALMTNPYNAKIFGISPDANTHTWCLLYDMPCYHGAKYRCGLNRCYKLNITITADARLLKGTESPESLIVPLREFVFKKLGGWGELPEVTVDYKEIEKEYYTKGRKEALERLRELSTRMTGMKWIKDFLNDLEKEEVAK